ncbi:MFS transporter [Streptomyces cyaneofuscatus]|uniref:MFS transporter n=2 Tax=Streptomyces cyaneofuscatus TaxID=66883 RepID=UPI0037FB378A|nr:MFS transporter [Streptomyces cyaneofuscatus]
MQGPVTEPTEGPPPPSALPDIPTEPAVSQVVTGRPLRRMMACAAPAHLSVALVWGAVPSILLALQIQRTVGEGAKVGSLALVTTVGAIVAMVAQPVAGAVSDRTRSRFGRRTPWIVAGALTGGTALIVMGFSRSVPAVLAAWCFVHIGYNFAMGPLSAVMPDRVPSAQRGKYAAVLGLGSMGGSLLGQTLGAVLEDHITLAYVLLASFSITAVSVFVLVNPDRSNRDVPREPFRVAELVRGLLPHPRKHPDFFWVFVGRLCTYQSYFLVLGYKLYILQDYIGLGDEAISRVPALAGAGVAGILPSTLVCGPLSDRLGRRKPFVVASAALVGCAMLVPLAVPTMGGMLTMAFLVGLGFGCFQGVDTALISQVLPSRDSFARDLGVVNIAAALPQALAPAVAAAVVLGPGGYQALFPAAAAFGVLGAVAVLRVRSVR